MSSNAADFSIAGAIPRPLTSLVGRNREIDEIAALLQSHDVRLVTLTGPGGVGKTRLAIETASVVTQHFPDGVAFIALASLTEPEAVLPAVARALRVQERGDLPIVEQLAASIHDRRVLLIVDNIEHLLEAAPDLALLLGLCPMLKMLATSRARLRLSGEWEYEIGPLALPLPTAGPPGDITGLPASVQLFAKRASAADSKFSLTESNLSAVEEICRRLGGLPLAIELAAARVRFMPPGSMVEQLPNSLANLGVGGPDMPVRHRSMSIAIRWSYELLSRFQQSVFRTLAVFVDSFTLDAATDVLIRACDTDAVDVETAVEALVDQSLLRVIESADGRPRFSMLEPLRDFAAELSESSNELETIRLAHARHFLEFVERGRPHFGPGRVAKVQAVERETANIYAALGWLINQNQAELALRMSWDLIFTLWQPRGRIRDQQVWMHRVIELPGGGFEAERAGAYVGLGLAEARSGRFDAAFSAAKEALTIARISGDPEKIAWALVLNGILSWRTEMLDESRVLLESALELARQLDDRFLCGWAHHNLAVCEANARRESFATSHFDMAQSLFEQLGDPWELADLEGNLAWYLETIGKISRSAQLERHAMKEHLRLGEAWLMQFSFMSAGAHANAIGRSAQAVRILSAMTQLRRQTGTAVPFGYEELYALELDRARDGLPDDEFADAWSAGESMTLDAIVAEADVVFEAWGETEASGGARSMAPYGLSPRELEVLRLLAAGKSNRQIGEELFITVPTVKVHVRSIMGKLELDSRTALAAFAIRHQLD
ncbi:MAG: LuxR C-terminal-related transcriptional regulator [Thermomicrobiales bacterium]